ncbi:hypothetical protein OS493_038738, partial [Desmophyllum pertusum]
MEDYSVTSNRNDDRELPEEEDPYGRIEEYLQSQLDSVVNSSTPKAATGLEKTSSFRDQKPKTNVTFTMTPNSHQSPTATLILRPSFHSEAHTNANDSKSGHCPSRLVE